MTILYLISLSFAALFIYIKPFVGLVVYLAFDTYINMQTTNLFPIPNMKIQFALFNQLIILILIARVMMSQGKNFFFTKDSKNLITLVLIFIIWSFSSIIWTDIINEKQVVFQLERLFKMLIFTFAIFLTIKNKTQLKNLLFIGLASYFIQNLFQIIEFVANDRATVQGGGLALLVFSVIMAQRKISLPLKIFSILCIFLVVGSVLLTGTRRGLGSLFIILLITVYYNYSNIKISRIIFPAFTLFISLYVFYEVNSTRRIDQTIRMVNWDDSGAWGGRNILWKAGASMIYERPVFGHGLGVSRGQMGKYVENKEYRKTNLRMHNSYLKAWAELGIVGLILFLMIIFKTVRLYFKSAFLFREQKKWVDYAILFGSSMQLIGLSLEGFFGWSGYMDKVLWFYVALALSLHKVQILDKDNMKPIVAQ